MNEFKSSRHTYQVRPLSTEACDSLRSLGVLKRFRGKSSRNKVKSGGRFPTLPQITTNFRSKQSFELKRVNFHNLINIQIKSDETNEVKRNNNPVIHQVIFSYSTHDRLSTKPWNSKILPLITTSTLWLY